IALISEDPSERGWYHTKLAHIDFAQRTATILHRSSWQLQGPAISPDKKHVAFLEGWSSDRGLVAGEVRLPDLARGKAVSAAADRQSNITALQWRGNESLWFAGWSRLGSIYGVLGLDGNFVWTEQEDAVIGPNSFLASITPAPNNEGFA